MSLRRKLNRLSGAKMFRKKGAARQASAGKRGVSVGLPLLLVLGLSMQAFFVSIEVLRKLEESVRIDAGAVRVSGAVFQFFRTHQAPRSPDVRDEQGSGTLQESLEQHLKYLPGNPLDGNNAEDLVARFHERGLDAFVNKGVQQYDLRELMRPLDREAAWLRAFMGAVAVMLLILFLNVVLMSLGPANNDLGKVGWSFEWLFTFPLSTRSLYTARLLDYAVTNFYGWILFGWFLVAIHMRAGVAWWGVLLGAAISAFCLNLMAGAARLLIETWLRLHLPRAKVRNLQAGFTILAMVSLFFIFAFGVAPSVPSWLAGDGMRQPFWRWAFPWSAPVFAFGGGMAALFAIVGIAAAAFAVGAAAVTGCSRMVRGGLAVSSGSFLGKRGKQRGAARQKRSLFRGILKKEMMLIRRDRNLFASMFIVPLFFVGIQFVLNSGMFEAAARNANHAAAIAFGMGAYILLTGGLNMLASEGKAIWILYTFPERLSRLLRWKLVAMTTASLIYVLLMLGYLAFKAEGWGAEAVGACVMAVAGVAIYAFISGGMGALGFDPLAEETGRKRINVASVYGYMLLAAMYGYGIYAPSVAQKIATIVMAVFLAFAIWQKVDERLPYLLDPSENPPPRLTLSFAMSAAFGFFVLQGIALMILAAASGGAPGAAEVTIAFSIAGAVVVAAACAICFIREIPSWWEEIGLASPRPRAFQLSLLYGVVGGLAAAAIAWGYLSVVDRVPVLLEMREEAKRQGIQSDSWVTLALLAVVAAPVFEEFIFRGLLFRALGRAMRSGWAAVASAAVFAVVHPGLSMVPVFALGLAAALCFRRTGLLLAPIVAHAVYNGMVMFFLNR